MIKNKKHLMFAVITVAAFSKDSMASAPSLLDNIYFMAGSDIAEQESIKTLAAQSVAAVIYEPLGHPSMRLNLGYGYTEENASDRYNSLNYGIKGHNIAVTVNFHF